jgi:REP element-mobilizing transposase RayT
MPPIAPSVLAYHLTWTTYGSWLPGDARGWVRKNYNGVQSPQRKREENYRKRLSEEPVELTKSQRVLIQETITKHCEIRNWPLHAVNARTNHVHVIVTADRDTDEVMNQLKAWCSRALSDAAGLQKPLAKKAGRRHWFTEGGDKQVIEDTEYLRNAIKYVVEGQ